MQQLKRLFGALEPFTPTLVGTYPLGLQVSDSDFDIVCCSANLAEFERALAAALRDLDVHGASPRRVALAPEASVTNFDCDGLPVEVFCQPLSVAEQHGFRHMIVEGRLLALGGPKLRERVLALRRSGTKTEPAFAAALGIDGDPYAAILALEGYTQPQLTAILISRGLL